MSEGLDFSVILPVYHSGRFLQEALSSLQGVDFPPERFEVIVSGGADDRSARGIVEQAAAEALFHMAYVDCARPTRSARLNAACAAARGKVLAFSDDDCVFPRDWLRRVQAACAQQEELGILGGTDEAVSGSSVLNRAMEWTFRSFWAAGGSRTGRGLGAGRYYPHLWNMAMPREVAFAVAQRSDDGPLQVFNESFDVHEDLELARRVEQAGRRLVFAPQVRVFHYRDTTFSELMRRNYAMAGTARALGTHRAPHVLLTGGLVGAVCLAAVSAAFPRALLVFLACVMLYGLLLAGSGLSAAVRTGDARVGALVPAVVAGLHLVRAVGYVTASRPKSL